MNLFGKPKPPKESVYEGLRMQILQGSREKLGIPAPASPSQTWGVVMDWGLENGSATVVALSDGTASVYLTSGGGSIGGGKSHEAIHAGAINAVSIAAKFRPKMRPAENYPLLALNGVTFYVLTDTGVFSESASAGDLSSDQHAMSPLGDAMQEIITQYRKIEQ